ncbi:sarcosine oxidase subunit gamma [Pelagibacterium halotolerans]|uniref:sarcosine oxidase subunit gamma n=1 Tax=Pelagibacterium halotolerans TaxID=531813 RepID=UPI00384CA1FB
MHYHHPLEGQELTVLKASPFTIRPVPDCARFSLRIDPDRRDAASAVFGLELPGAIGGLTSSGEKTAICLGPDEWYLLAPAAEKEVVEKSFGDLYGREIHSLTDISHREVGIAVEGREAALALQSAIAFDVEAMPVGSGRRTLFDKAQIVLLREAEDRFRIEVWHSFSEHVWHLLQAAGREIELGI